jgi:hypothetical protein
MRATQIALLAAALLLVPTSYSSPRSSQSSPQDQPPSVSRTQIKLITPFNSGGLRIGFAVTSRGSGTCFAESAAVPARPDAWRCSIGNAIHDPCFQNILGDPKVLACPDTPWSANVTLLTLTSPLPTADRKDMNLKDTLPWALELAAGQRCTLFTGATAPIAGMRINYGCPGGFIAVGDVDRSQPVWRIFVQGEKSISLDLTDIAVVWY